MSKRVYRGRRCRSQWNIWMIAVPAALVLLAGGWMLWSILRPVPVQSAPMVPLHESKRLKQIPPTRRRPPAELICPRNPVMGLKCRRSMTLPSPPRRQRRWTTAILRTPPLWAIPRTDGFLIYSGIGCGENLTSNGLSIFKLAEKKALTIDGTQYTLLEALESEAVRQGIPLPGRQ